MLKEMWNFECSAVVIVTPLVLIMKDKVEELSNLASRHLYSVLETKKSSLEMIHQSVIVWLANLLEFVAQD